MNPEQTSEPQGKSPQQAPSPWAAVLSIGAGTFLLVCSEFLPIGLLGQMASSLGTTAGQIGLAVAVPGVVAAVAAPLLALVAGGVDRKWALLGLTGSIVASNALVAFAPSLTLLLVGRVLLGIAVGGFWTFAAAAGRKLVRQDMGTRATAIISAGISLGTVLGVPAGALLGEWVGWRWVFGITAAMGALIAVAQERLLPSIPVERTVRLGDMLGLLHVRLARFGLIAALFIAGGHFSAYTYLEPYLRDVVQAGPEGVAFLLFAYALSGVGGTMLAERLLQFGLPRAFVAVAAVLALIVLGGPWLGLTLPGAFLVVAAWGFSFGALPIFIQVWMFESAPKEYESSSALVVSVFQIGLATGAVLGGLVVDSRGVPGAFIVGGVLTIIAIAAAMLSRSPSQSAFGAPR